MNTVMSLLAPYEVVGYKLFLLTFTPVLLLQHQQQQVVLDLETMDTLTKKFWSLKEDDNDVIRAHFFRTVSEMIKVEANKDSTYTSENLRRLIQSGIEDSQVSVRIAAAQNIIQLLQITIKDLFEENEDDKNDIKKNSLLDMINHLKDCDIPISRIEAWKCYCAVLSTIPRIDSLKQNVTWLAAFTSQMERVIFPQLERLITDEHIVVRRHCIKTLPGLLQSVTDIHGLLSSASSSGQIHTTLSWFFTQLQRMVDEYDPEDKEVVAMVFIPLLAHLGSIPQQAGQIMRTSIAERVFRESSICIKIVILESLFLVVEEERRIIIPETALPGITKLLFQCFLDVLDSDRWRDRLSAVELLGRFLKALPAEELDDYLLKSATVLMTITKDDAGIVRDESTRLLATITRTQSPSWRKQMFSRFQEQLSSTNWISRLSTAKFFAIMLSEATGNEQPDEVQTLLETVIKASEDKVANIRICCAIILKKFQNQQILYKRIAQRLQEMKNEEDQNVREAAT